MLKNIKGIDKKYFP